MTMYDYDILTRIWSKDGPHPRPWLLLRRLIYHNSVHRLRAESKLVSFVIDDDLDI